MSIFFLVLDGCAPEYFTAETAPRLHRLAGAHGFVKRVQCAMPSVTNVNHACLLSGKWPEETGIAGNYVYDPKTGREGFLEERGYMRAPTLLQWARRAGGKTALLTVKGKILGVYGEGADIRLSAEKPDPALLERLGLDAAGAELIALTGLSAKNSGLERLGAPVKYIPEPEAIGEGACWLTGLSLIHI